jgi:hypothetical protein
VPELVEFRPLGPTPHARQLVVRLRQDGVSAPSVRSLRSARPKLAAQVEALGITLEPLFPIRRATTRALAPQAPKGSAYRAARLSTYAKVTAPGQDLDAIAESLSEHPDVAAAYVKPPTFPPGAVAGGGKGYVDRQGYLEAAPGGVDARFAWTRPGGKGAGVQIADVEGEWRLGHEALPNTIGLVSGTPQNDLGWRNHGTAVIAELVGRDTLAGIAPEARLHVASIFPDSDSTSVAIKAATDALGSGDVLLIELHRPGPRFGGEARDDERGYIPVEWWPDDLDVIRYAVERGVLVVEAGGNGAEDLDDVLYDTPLGAFGTDWKNPFRRKDVDSGALVVGAGAPPSGAQGPDRSRLDFSNFGAAFDAQGWGLEIVTAGYGDLSGADEDHFYTATFGGTSGASPMIAGVLACVQGVRRAAGQPLLTPADARALLRGGGSPQQDAPGRPATERIGSRPDLRRLV